MHVYFKRRIYFNLRILFVLTNSIRLQLQKKCEVIELHLIQGICLGQTN